jgi:cobalt-zinc-cadmium efflux system protein
MANSHDHHHAEHHEHHNCDHSHGVEGVHLHGLHVHGASNRILFALGLNAVFTVIEFLGAYQYQSVAVLADATHDAGDTLALGMAAVLQFLALRPPTGQFTFGMRRLSLLAALLTGLLLVFGSGFVIVKAITAIGSEHLPVPGGMAALAVFGILINGAAVLRLRGGKSLNEQMLSLHLLEDVLGWLLVLVTAVVMHFVYLPILDIGLSLALAGFILYRAARNLAKTVRLFLEAVPEGVSLTSLAASIQQLPRVLAVHDLHVWSMDGEYHLLACHVVVSDDFSIDEAEGLKKSVRVAVAHLGIAHATIEVERESEECGDERTHGDRKGRQSFSHDKGNHHGHGIDHIHPNGHGSDNLDGTSPREAQSDKGHNCCDGH